MRSSVRCGMTLIEVVAGIALLGALLTVLLVSGAQHLRQLKLAEHKRQSVSMLEDFLAAWSMSNFERSGISSAVARSGLPATGQYGNHGGAHHGSPYQVELRRTGTSEFGIGSVVRLTVRVANAGRVPRETAWAEVIVLE